MKAVGRKYFLVFITLVFVQHLFAQVPTISSFTPTSGPIGTVVTITGTNFSATTANNIVYFGAVKVKVTNANATTLTVTAPAGATYMPITVTVNGFTGYSSQLFTETFSGIDSSFVSTSFANPVNFQGSTPGNLSLSDIDGDGKPDLIFSDWSQGGTTVVRNTSVAGAVSFASGATVSSGYTGNFGIGDFDGDGKIDIAAALDANVNNGAVIFRNTSTVGNISFASAVNAFILNQNQPQTGAISIGDLNGDGKPDIALIFVGPNNFSELDSITVFQNTSTGVGNISFANPISFYCNNGSQGIVIGDIDGDGKPEIITTGGSTSILRNTSTNGNISFAPVINVTGSGSCVALGDMDGDSKLDIIVSSGILRNTSTVGSISFSSLVGGAYNLFSVGDIDGDGKPDIVVTTNDTIVSVFKNKSTVGNISFNSKIVYPINAFQTEGPQWGSCIGDIDGDGRPDIAVGNGYKDNNTGNNTSTGSVLISHIPRIDTWIGGADSIWEKASNWSCGFTPDAYTDVVINSGKVILNSNTTILSLTVNPTANFTVVTGYNLIVTH